MDASEQLKGLWVATSAYRDREYPAFNDDLHVDVIVIGGGFTGVSTAFHLAEKGISVVLLEARTIGFGGSGRNVGLVNAGLWTPPDQVEEKIGKAAGQRLNAELADGPSVVFDLIERYQIKCEAERNGTLHCANSEAGFRDLENRYAQQIARGAPVHLLDASETQARTGTSKFHGALLDMRAGTIQPLAYVQGLAAVAAANGAHIFERSCVNAVDKGTDHWHVKTNNGSVKAQYLIQATNAYGAGGAENNSIIPIYYFQIATAPMPDQARKTILAGREGCWDTALIMSSCRIDQAGRMIFGGLGNLDGFGGRTHETWARRKLENLFPQLANIPFEQSWCGRIAMTGTYLPRIERLGKNGISIFGYSGRGIASGTLFGKSAAAWIAGDGALSVEIVERKVEILPKTKGLYYETGATLTHLTSAHL